MPDWLRSSYPYFGLAGSLLVTLAILISGLLYRGKHGQRFSIFNHYISELGELGVSPAAGLFNAGLVLGGLLLVPFMIGLGLSFGGVLGWLALLAGLWTAVTCLLVGLFPMNYLEAHSRVATAYFRGGLVTVLLFSLAIFFQPANARVLPLAVNWVGALAVAAYASFLVLLGRHSDDGEDDPVEKEPLPQPEVVRVRPRFLLMPAVEWATFFTVILWFFWVALVLLGR